MSASKRLFIDDHVIERADGVVRTLNRPAKYVGNPVVIPLYPWEGRISPGTVWYDDDEERYRMWYLGLGPGGLPSLDGPEDSPWAGFDARNLAYALCYATSKDGVFWERPNLGLVDCYGSRANNVVLLHAGAANVIRDPGDPDPARRYKTLFHESRNADGTPNRGDGVSVGFSPDGVRWTMHEDNPVIERSSDSHRLLGWDEAVGKYVAYPRPTLHDGVPTRRIGRSVSDDFVHWSEPQTVLEPDGDDPDGLEFYSMPVFKYEGLYLGQLVAYHARPEEPTIRFMGTANVQLAVSRDGVSWERVGDRAAFIPNGPPGSIDHGEAYPAAAPVVVGDELWFYYGGSASEHGITGRSGPICLARLRLDGFVSVDAGDETGTLVTKPFRCDGGTLTVNAAAGGGLVGVAVLDESGIQHEGYSRAGCVLFDGDSVRHRVTWRDNVSLAPLKGQSISLKFYLRNASLYSFVC